MKQSHTFRALAAVSFAVLAVAASAADFREQLGLTEQVVRANAVESLTGGYVPVYMVAARFKAAAPAVRVAIIKSALTWAKAYSATPDFASRYQQLRTERKPATPAADALTVDQELKQKQAEQQKQIDDMKKSVARMPADQRKAMEPIVQQSTAQLDAMNKDPKMQAMLRQGLESQRASAHEQYDKDVKRWNDDFPAEPKQLIGRRIKELLAASADVDFDAKLTPRYGKMAFVNPAYESKPSNWKTCYRAGRESVEAARAFASAWLAELK